MKKLSLKKLFLQSVALISMLALATSCSESNHDDILGKVPQSAQFVLVGNPSTIAKSANVSLANSQVTLPDYIKGLLSTSDLDDVAELNTLIADIGIDIEAPMAMFCNYNQPTAAFVCQHKDRKKIEAWLADKKYTENTKADGYTFYTRLDSESEYGTEYYKYTYFAVGDNYVYLIPDMSSPKFDVKDLLQIVSDAKKRPMSKTAYGKYAAEGNALGVIAELPDELRQELRNQGLPADMANTFSSGKVCAKGDLEGDKAEIKITFFDLDGKKKDFSTWASMMDFKAKVDKKALNFLADDEMFVMATALKNINWDTYLDLIAQSLPREDRMALVAAKPYLQKIDGTIAIGFGLTNGISSAVLLSQGQDVLNQFSATVVIQTKAGQANSLINDVKSLMSMGGMPYATTDNGIAMTIPQVRGAVYVEAIDDCLILANHPISNKNHNATIDDIDFDDYIGGLGFVALPYNQLMRDLNLDNKIAFSILSDPNNVEAEMEMEIDGKAGFVEAFIKTILKIGEASKTFMPYNYGSNYSYLDEDSFDIDEDW